MERRLQAVKEYLELSFSKENELEELVYLASEICQTPIASITLVDDKKQYPVIGIGNVVESSCNIAFCNHTIQEVNILEIPDATRDARFINNPLVTGEPHIRFYAGIPLITTDGNTIGSLCVIDQQPKKLTEKQVKSLEILSKQVMHRLEFNMNMQLLKDKFREAEQNRELLEQAEVMKHSFYNNSDHYFLLLNKSLQIVSFNSAAEDFFRRRNEGSQLENGKDIFEYVSPANVPAVKEKLEIAQNGASASFEILANPTSKNEFWNRFTVSPAYNSQKELIGIACIGCNIDKEKKQQAKIDLQSLTLSQIAQLHAHEIRHPLTNILGIIEIIKKDNFKPTRQFIEYLETASKELDQVIKNIVLDSHKAAYLL